MKYKSYVEQNNGNNVTDGFIQVIILILSIICIIEFNSYSMIYKKVLGLLILTYSIRLLMVHAKDKIYCLLFAIILYSNLTIVISDCFSNGTVSLPSNTLAWQIYRDTYYEVIFLKALLLLFMVLNLILNRGSHYILKNDMKEELEISFYKNNIIFWGSLIVLTAGLVKGYDFTRGNQYISNSNALYEYCILLFLLAWLYAGKSKLHHGLLVTYAALYCGQAILFGDRSAAFPMLLLILILYFGSLSVFKVILLSLGGIIAANMIAVYRLNYSLTNFGASYLARYGAMSITSDTVSQAYYTGVSLVGVKEIIGQTANYFFDFLLGIFLGGDYGYANVVSLGKQYATNKGGGMVITSFYFWFGFCGVILLAVIIGYLLKRMGMKHNRFYTAWRIYLTVSVFRWYLYNSFVFFRGVVFLFPLLYFLFFIADRLIKRKGFVLKMGNENQNAEYKNIGVDEV